MRLSLQSKILLLIAGTVMGMAAIILTALMNLTGREIDRAVQSDVRVTGGVLGQLVRERNAALLTRCQLLADQPALRKYFFGREGAAARNDWETVTGYARDALQSLHADVALLTDDAGRALGETDSAVPARTRRTEEAGVGAALQGESWAGIVMHGERLMLAVSVPITEPVAQTVQGTLTAYRAIDAVLAEDLKRALGSDVAFVHQGRVVGASLPVPTHLPTPREAPQQVRVGTTRYFALYASLPQTDAAQDLGFVILRPYDQAMALHHRLQKGLILLSIPALLLAPLAGLGVARSITRPLIGVVRAAQTLREGGWPETFAVQRADEIGVLQSAFNEMTVALRAGQERLLALIDTDPLTELDNHRQFQERLVHEARRCAGSGEALSLLLIDLDHFQSYNQRYGHSAGDGALKQVAQLLRDGLPEVAITARFAGDRFAVVLPRQEMEEAEQVAERIRQAVQDRWTGEGEPELTLSIGVAQFGKHSAQAEGLVLAAELAVSQAKQLGRNRVCLFEAVPGADDAADPFQLHRFLKDGSLATIQALAAAVDAKDSYTQGHSQRVARYAADLARYVGLPESVIELVFITGTLHDVGKIGVPDSILKKPGQLDEEERAIMETHPVLGEVIVRKAPQLVTTLPGVRNHHERWDGRGYPDGLAGAAIPQVARLLAVADTFDAMTSDRPYRKGLAVEFALEEIAKNAGTQFDPELAPPFVAMMRASRLGARGVSLAPGLHIADYRRAA